MGEGLLENLMDGLVLPALFELLDEVGVLDASTDEEREGGTYLQASKKRGMLYSWAIASQAFMLAMETG